MQARESLYGCMLYSIDLRGEGSGGGQAKSPATYSHFFIGSKWLPGPAVKYEHRVCFHYCIPRFCFHIAKNFHYKNEESVIQPHADSMNTAHARRKVFKDMQRWQPQPQSIELDQFLLLRKLGAGLSSCH